MQSKGRHETKLWFQLFTFMNFDVFGSSPPPPPPQIYTRGDFLGGEGGFPWQLIDTHVYDW